MTNDTKEPDHGHRFAAYSAAGVHVGLWNDGKIAADVLAEYPGGYIEELVTLPEALAAQGALLERAAGIVRKNSWQMYTTPYSETVQSRRRTEEELAKLIEALSPDATAALEAVSREAVEQERASWEPVASALWQLLDDMGNDGKCVCEAAKEDAKAAYMRKVDGLFPEILDASPAAIREGQRFDEGT